VVTGTNPMSEQALWPNGKGLANVTHQFVHGAAVRHAHPGHHRDLNDTGFMAHVPGTMRYSASVRLEGGRRLDADANASLLAPRNGVLSFDGRWALDDQGRGEPHRERKYCPPAMQAKKDAEAKTDSITGIKYSWDMQHSKERRMEKRRWEIGREPITVSAGMVGLPVQGGPGCAQSTLIEKCGPGTGIDAIRLAREQLVKVGFHRLPAHLQACLRAGDAQKTGGSSFDDFLRRKDRDLVKLDKEAKMRDLVAAAQDKAVQRRRWQEHGDHAGQDVPREMTTSNMMMPALYGLRDDFLERTIKNAGGTI
jgi:hypothetical protein